MRDLVKTFDAFINRFTMYRVVLYGLICLLMIADGLAWTGAISIGPVALLVSIAVLIPACYVVNRIFAQALKAAYNTESWLVTALILACILPPARNLGQALYVGLCAAIAMASKYLIVWRGSHFLNPAAFGAFILTITGLLPATWWVATPNLLPFTAILAVFVLRKQRKFALFAAFALSALAIQLYVGVLHDQSVLMTLKNELLSFPLVFMGSIMLTEPITLPPTRYYQLWSGILVGTIFACQLRLGSLTATPQAALLAGNLLTVLAIPAFGAVIKLKNSTNLAPDILELIFEKPARNFSFAPGQYMEWTLPHEHTDSRGNRRMFSIASGPSEEDLRIAIRQFEPGSSFKKALSNLKLGRHIRVAHVAGNFLQSLKPSQNSLLIAGGIGITPFVSLTKEIVAKQIKSDICLVYVAANQHEFVYKDLFAKAEPYGMRAVYVTSRLTKEDLLKLVPDIKSRAVYISGPNAMVSNYQHSISAMGVPASKVHTDHFSGY